MAATCISIRVDIPKGNKVSMDELRQQVSMYAQFIVNQARPAKKAGNVSSILSLRGILKTQKTDGELLGEYFKDKYGL